ncbi:MAG: hypothetical protein V8T86_11495 [Victivallis sp.]
MNEVNRARWGGGGGIFLVIILILIVCNQLYRGDPTARGTGACRNADAADGCPCGAAAAGQRWPCRERQPENKKKSGGFWLWLFGGGDKKEPESEPEEVRPPRVYRYKKPSENPVFGKPFNYALAKTGDFSEKEVPGSRGATSGIMVDLGTRTVCGRKNSSKQVPSAVWIVKSLTLLVAFEATGRHPSLSSKAR